MNAEWDTEADGGAIRGCAFGCLFEGLAVVVLVLLPLGLLWLAGAVGWG